MRLLITGGRGYDDWVRVQRTLDPYAKEYGSDLIIIEGGATGADRLARRWAQARGVHVATVDALWNYYENAAGPIRNSAMLILRPDEVIAFPGNTGTADMMEKARRAGIKVTEYV